MRTLRARNKARVFPESEIEMLNQVMGIQHKNRSREAGRIVIRGKTEIKIPISITTKSRVAIRKIRRSHPRRPLRRATIGTTAIGIDVIAASS